MNRLREACNADSSRYEYTARGNIAQRSQVGAVQAFQFDCAIFRSAFNAPDQVICPISSRFDVERKFVASKRRHGKGMAIDEYVPA